MNGVEVRLLNVNNPILRERLIRLGGSAQSPALQLGNEILYKPDEIISFLTEVFLKRRIEESRQEKQQLILSVKDGCAVSRKLLEWMRQRQINIPVRDLGDRGTTQGFEGREEELVPSVEVDGQIVAVGAEASKLFLLKELLLSNPKKADVVLYTAKWCHACSILHKILQEEGLSVAVKDVDDPQYLNEFQRLGGSGIPSLAVNGRIEFVGPSEIVSFLRFLRED